MNDLATAPAPASDASLNLRSAPSESPAARSCCPSSMVLIHLGSSGGGGTTTAESDVEAEVCGVVFATLVVGAGTVAVGWMTFA